MRVSLSMMIAARLWVLLSRPRYRGMGAYFEASIPNSQLPKESARCCWVELFRIHRLNAFHSAPSNDSPSSRMAAETCAQGAGAPRISPGPRRSPCAERPMVVGKVPTMYSLSKRFCTPKNTSTLRHDAREAVNRRSAYSGRPGSVSRRHGPDVQVVVELRADGLHAEREVDELRDSRTTPAPSRDASAPAAGSCRRAPGLAGGHLAYLGLIVEIAAGHRQTCRAGIDVGLQAARSRVRPRFWRCCVTLAPTSTVVTLDTGFLTRLSNQVRRTQTVVHGATLTPPSPPTRRSGPSSIVGEREDRADAELAVQLVERRRAEPGSRCRPRR